MQDYRITDTRYEAERCGVVSSISEFDTSTLNNQLQAWAREQQAEFSAWVETIKGILDEATAGHLQNEIDAINSNIAELPASNVIVGNNKNLPAKLSEIDNAIAGKQEALVYPLTRADLVNNGETADTTKALSANYGRLLKNYTDEINARVSTLESDRNLMPIVSWNIDASDINYFFNNLRGYVHYNIPAGNGVLIGGSWSGHSYMTGYVVKVTDDIYSGIIDFIGGGTFAFSNSGQRQIEYK